MNIKKIQMIPPGYTDIVHPETSADNIIETDSKKIMTGDERAKLGSIPSDAVFTDTITTINGKTGAISKADIVALGIPAQDTIVDISGKADITYVDGKVLTDVPLNAKFTDTVYSHPSTHPASMITGLPTSLPADGGNADTVGGFTVGVNVPADAVFTDTVTTINGKTGAISKADIVALGIPSSDTNTTYSEITTAEIDTGTASTLRTITGRRVKYILDKVQGWIGELTKSDVGLSNVDNTSDLDKPISTAMQAELTAINSTISNLSGGKGGESLFAGNGLEKTIAHGLGSIPTSAYAFPKVNPEGFLGEVWVRFDATNVYVGNTGSFTGAMIWGVIK